MGKGGRREGAGRKKTGPSTKAIRVPIDFPDRDDVVAIYDILNQWEEIIEEGSGPRYWFAKKLFRDLKPYLHKSEK